MWERKRSRRDNLAAVTTDASAAADENGYAEFESALVEEFARVHGAGPTRLVRAPGRVNLIGEHTDYNGLPVLPIAIQREILIAFRPRDDALVRLANLDSRYRPAAFRLEKPIVPDAPGAWPNYVRAAATTVLEAAGRPLIGLDMMVSATLPAAAGLASSAALVVASALALLDANRITIPLLELADLLARGERYVGTQGGGMDQAICLCGDPGAAYEIDFFPLTLARVPVPGDWRFIVASSLVDAHKTGAAREAYNTRVRECREALSLMGAESYAQLLTHNGTDSLVEMAGRRLSAQLLRRFRHVVTEAARVTDAREAMESGDIVRFGALMDASHQSLRDDYEVSCTELDEIVSIARSAGAAGARLTGAGFGGAAVALCRAPDGEQVRSALIERYYALRLGGRPADDACFQAIPSNGARVLPL